MQRQTIRVASLLRSQHSLSFDQTRTLYADVKNNKVVAFNLQALLVEEIAS